MDQTVIPVFFDERMVAPDALPSPSAGKPEKALHAWQVSAMPIEVMPFEPMSLDDLCRAHRPRHVAEVMDLTRKNGFGTHSATVAATLPWTSGSLYAAARWALDHRGIACSPTSGFHHAEYESVHGYCTFNGLMVTAMRLLHEERVRRVGILDFDHHYGNGTQDIIEHFGLEQQVEHVTSNRDYPTDPDGFFKVLPELLVRMKGVDLLLYQAGADAHIDDPLGGFLTSEQMRERDRRVFEFVVERGIPTAWNLAGGYQEETLPDGRVSIAKVLALHVATMDECAKALRLDPKI